MMYVVNSVAYLIIGGAIGDVVGSLILVRRRAAKSRR